MGRRPSSFNGPTIPVGPTSSKLFVADEVFESVVNGYPTEEGSYRSVYTPAPLLPAAGGGAPASGDIADHTPLQYGPVYGIHHALIQGGERELLLLHTGKQIWEMRWWDRAWFPLIGPAVVTDAQQTVASLEMTSNKWPTQWVSTPTGVVITPQNSRSFFYDGTVVSPLGFAETPVAPLGLGPESSTGEWNSDVSTGGVNDQGYNVHGLIGRPGAMDEHLGKPRLGSVFVGDALTTTLNGTNQVGGYLLPARYRCRVQYVDRHGNLSPLSEPSNDVAFDKQPSSYFASVAAAGSRSNWVTPDKARRQIAWDGISSGPQHTVGRILYRTKDLENSGDSNYYELPINGAGSPGAIATLPDRQSTLYPDNVPDGWLVNQPIDVDPVPTFRLAALAFSRLWVANEEGDEGMLRPSEVGLWGTFPSALKLYPDPRAAEVTGLHAVDEGLLVFTETSTFLVTPNDAGDGFRSRTLSTTAGCVAPSSIATMRDGTTVWLGQDGFYAHKGGVVDFIFKEHRRRALRINKAKYGYASAIYDFEAGQYQCWVPVDGSYEPNRRYKFDGANWHFDDYDGTVDMRQVCITSDHRRIQIGCGGVGSDVGVWALDRGGAPQVMTVKTGWLRALRSRDRAQVHRVYLWLREASTSAGVIADKIQVKTRRNWRAEVVDTFTTEPTVSISDVRDYEQTPTFFPFVADDADAIIRRRRPFWAAVDVHIPHTEVFQLEISCTKSWEIMGISIDEVPVVDGGASIRRG